jgi:hypothetical protein
MKQKRKWFYLLFAIGTIVMMLNGCGGDDTTASAGSNWDEMEWDQGQWN